MRVNDTVIVTPIDNPGQYDPDWRNGLATALFESDDRIDPVGACVGMKGFRIHGIVRELRNENIDVINYTNGGAVSGAK